MAAISFINQQASNSPLNAALSANASSDSSSSTTSSDDTATISANDFLELLVTEMQNQDPTATTDPNEYINQLVNVNSLEQLVSINQTLTDSLGTSSTSATSSDISHRSAGTSAAPLQSQSVINAHSDRATDGNLGIPTASNAAQRISTALSQPRS